MKYLVTIRYSFEANDDIEARVKAKLIVADSKSVSFDEEDKCEPTFKLQNIKDGKEPKKVAI